MSKKGKRKKSKVIEDVNEIEGIESVPSASEIGYITTAILDYYESTGSQPLEDGDEWKSLDPDKYMSKGVKIPNDLDEEIKKAFISQIKRFQ